MYLISKTGDGHLYICDYTLSSDFSPRLIRRKIDFRHRSSWIRCQIVNIYLIEKIKRTRPFDVFEEVEFLIPPPGSV